mgnify:CR=1 FL=1
MIDFLLSLIPRFTTEDVGCYLDKDDDTCIVPQFSMDAYEPGVKSLVWLGHGFGGIVVDGPWDYEEWLQCA